MVAALRRLVFFASVKAEKLATPKSILAGLTGALVLLAAEPFPGEGPQRAILAARTALWQWEGWRRAEAAKQEPEPAAVMPGAT